MTKLKNGFTSKEIARQAGAKSKRGPNPIIKELREAIHERIKQDKCLEKAFKELAKLEGSNYIKSLALLMNYILPQLKAVELSGEVKSESLLNKFSLEELYLLKYGTELKRKSKKST